MEIGKKIKNQKFFMKNNQQIKRVKNVRKNFE